MIHAMAMMRDTPRLKAPADKRVAFERGYPCRLVSIDGVWLCSALLEDISDDGAKLMLLGATERFNATEFFLVLTKKGAVHRRCARARFSGQQIEVQFVRRQPERARPRARRFFAI